MKSDIGAVEFVRNWVHINSIHLIDEEHDRYAFFVPEVLKRLLAASDNTGCVKPHLSCGPRAYAMKEILDDFGIKTRIVDIFDFGQSKFNPHTLLDVYIEDESHWTLQDPDFNVCYTNSIGGERISSLKALKLPSENISYTSGSYEPAMMVNLKNTINQLFSKVVLHRFSYTGKKSIAYIADESACKQPVIMWKGRRVNFMDYLRYNDHGPKIELVRAG